MSDPCEFLRKEFSRQRKQQPQWRWGTIKDTYTDSGLPWGLSGKELSCQCWRYRFDLWVRKVPWRRIWQPTPVFLPRKPEGQRSMVGYSPRGRKRVRHDLVTKQHMDCVRAWNGRGRCDGVLKGHWLLSVTGKRLNTVTWRNNLCFQNLSG